MKRWWSLRSFVFPARAGMFPRLRSAQTYCQRFPRASGDVPKARAQWRKPSTFSPRERGCSLDTIPLDCSTVVFPARAGMFLKIGNRRIYKASFPRASGDVPGAALCCVHGHVFSPRERGCSWLGDDLGPNVPVFPARAGMFRG